MTQVAVEVRQGREGAEGRAGTKNDLIEVGGVGRGSRPASGTALSS